MQKSSILAIASGGVLVALLLGAALVISGGGASATKSQAEIAAARTTGEDISPAEANAWAEARAADTPAAYGVYLAAFPNGAFENQAYEARGAAQARATAPAAAKVTRVVEQRSSGPSRATITSRCRAYVDNTLSNPDKMTRTVGGAAAGCAVGALAGGSDGRNCAIGAVVGGGTGYLTAKNRQQKRETMMANCVANGGPPG